MDNPIPEFLLLYEEVRNSEEYKAISRIKANEMSFRLFLRNYYELKHLLNTTEEYRVAIELGSDGKQAIHHIVMEEVTYLLHNYVASVMSLVAHTRRHLESLYEEKNPVRLEEIQKEIDIRFVDNETHQIIQGIRNYSLHRKLPVVGRMMHFNALSDKPEIEAKYIIDIASLLEWDGWKPLAKQKLEELINTSDEQVIFENKERVFCINQLITEHHQQVVSFYQWLGKKQKEWHNDDNQFLKEKFKEVEGLEETDST